VTHLLMELAQIECRLAALALAGGEVGEGARSLARAAYYLRLRAGEVEARRHHPRPTPARAD